MKTTTEASPMPTLSGFLTTLAKQVAEAGKLQDGTFGYIVTTFLTFWKALNVQKGADQTVTAARSAFRAAVRAEGQERMKALGLDVAEFHLGTKARERIKTAARQGKRRQDHKAISEALSIVRTFESLHTQMGHVGNIYAGTVSDDPKVKPIIPAALWDRVCKGAPGAKAEALDRLKEAPRPDRAPMSVTERIEYAAKHLANAFRDMDASVQRAILSEGIAGALKALDADYSFAVAPKVGAPE